MFPTYTKLKLRGHRVLQESPWVGGSHECFQLYSIEFSNPDIANGLIAM